MGSGGGGGDWGFEEMEEILVMKGGDFEMERLMPLYERGSVLDTSL